MTRFPLTILEILSFTADMAIPPFSIAMYREAIDLCIADREAYEDKKEQWIERIEQLQPANRSIDTGFFFKETVY